jgi:Protein of unknown function (DUF4236)
MLMPFYIRKSIKLGPFRLNFSKSGVGVSTGIKGARIGMNAKGKKYVHLGRGGLYYRQNLPEVTQSESGQDESGGAGISWGLLLIYLAALFLILQFFVK